jgi:hypothetical protein
MFCTKCKPYISGTRVKKCVLSVQETEKQFSGSPRKSGLLNKNYTNVIKQFKHELKG